MPKKTRLVKKTDIKADKAWNRNKGNYKYNVESRTPNKRFLIVCEGQTEELYFKSFPVYNVNVETVHSGLSKLSLVEYTMRLEREGDYDEIWCVFDYDYK